MTSPPGYSIIDNRPIDQWQVTELKEELKRRKLTTKGSKEELIKRLDEAICVEREDDGEEINNEVNDPKPEVVEEIGKIEQTVVGESETRLPVNDEKNADVDNGKGTGVEVVSFEVGTEDCAEEPNQEELVEQKVSEKVGDASSVVVDGQVCKSISAMGGQWLQDDKPEKNNEQSGTQQDSVDIKQTHDDVKLETSDPNKQVSEVDSNLGFPIKSNFVSMCEKNELEDNIIADNVRLEPDVKPEIVQRSSSELIHDSAKSHPMDVKNPLENELSVGETKNNVTKSNMSPGNLSANLGFSEKLNLDRSLCDDSMEEDAFESKRTDSYYNSGEVLVRTEKSVVASLKGEAPFTALDSDLPAKEKSTCSKYKDVVASADKRKLPDQEAVLSSEPSKRQQICKSEGNNIVDPQISSTPSPIAVNDVLQPAGPRRSSSRSDSGGAIDTSKEREVPPTNAATNSLKIDNFLRPFTLKAVQELLAKTGTVTSFWMDHIKTHCYVTYSSVEEAVATRNAIYNLQWPPKSKRHLVAEFVDPKDVNLHVNPLPQPPSKPVITPLPATEPSSRLPQPSPHKIDLRQWLSNRSTLPPLLPLSNHEPARELVLPPPPPIEEKTGVRVLSLDDLFRKTKARPRIYYMPLSEEQVSAQLAAQQKNYTQSSSQVST